MVERSVTKAEQFREYAEEVMQWSRQSRTEEAKKVLIDLSHLTQAASLRETARRSACGLTPPPETERKI
jgi:hypothetical protein